MAKSIEIRLHGRGGQGGVTCAKILAAAYAEQGLSVQTFGDYAGERSGAPVRAYTRASDEPITNRNKVYHPDHLLVLDPSLLGPDVVEGLAPGGSLLLNTPAPLASFAGRYEEFELATIDATAIARRHEIGTRTVVIVNTTLPGPTPSCTASRWTSCARPIVCWACSATSTPRWRPTRRCRRVPRAARRPRRRLRRSPHRTATSCLSRNTSRAVPPA
ncbi:MAG: 2-oxoacid:acceptor oxidoreductase family protein [Deltaproteobacteria bacterium]|nr:2-oxoacid:acceptor oxidoreductase family protein [Deltaproteobacteria bacterium]